MIRPDLVVVMAGVDMFALLIHLYFELDLIWGEKNAKASGQNNWKVLHFR